MPLRSPLAALNAGFDVPHKVRGQGAVNRQRNPQTTFAPAVPHRIIGLYGTSSNDTIDPKYIDRTITRMTVMVADPENWKDGDRIVFNNGAEDLEYEIIGDILHENRGPVTPLNRLFGGHFAVERVTG